MDTTTDLIELGKSGVRVPRMGIGTWAWGDGLVWGYGQGYGESDLRQAFDAAIAAGIQFFDTAEVYGFGKSEKFIGQFRREAPEGSQAVIATKFFPMPWRVTRGQMLSALRGSLKRLGMSQVDLYQLHWQLPPVSVEARMDALAETVHAGLTRAIGVSNYNAAQVERAVRRLETHGVPLASNQIEYSLLQRDPDFDGTNKVCRDLNVTVIAYSPIKMGLLTGKYTPTHPPPGTRGRRYSYAYLVEIQPLMALLKQLAEKYNKTQSQVALNWLIQQGAVPIPGAKNLKQLRENAGALGWQLAPDDVQVLSAVSADTGRKKRDHSAVPQDTL